MSEHTPGPWKVDSKYCVGPVSQEDDQSYGMIIPVADVYGPNIQADAELIASAPQLREQNRVLDGALRLVLESWVNGRKVRDGIGAAVLVTAQAALTATSQPAKPQGRMHACDIPGCVSCGNPEDATSQEGQHEA